MGGESWQNLSIRWFAFSCGFSGVSVVVSDYPCIFAV